MKKILIFSLQYYPLVGGAEVAIKEITDRIPKEEIEFHMITLRFDSTLPEVEQIGNVLVHRVLFTKKNPSLEDLQKFPLKINKHFYQIWAYLKAKQLHKKHHYDAVWGMMAHGAGIPAGLFKKDFPSIPYLLSLQEGDPLPHIEKLMKPVWPLFENGFVRADYLQAISTFLLEWGERMGNKGDIRLIPNGVDVQHFLNDVPSEKINDIRAQIGKKEGETWIITTSRLVHKNGIDTVIQSLKSLSSNIHFLVLGVGPDEEMLKKLAQECGVSDRVHFYGFVKHTDIPSFYKACDIFIRASRSEGMGNSFIEAMAAGLPVIGTNVGGIPDFLFDKQTGWVVEPEAPEQVVEAANVILGNKEKTKEVTDRARAMAIEKYDWKKVAGDMKALFEDMLSGR